MGQTPVFTVNIPIPPNIGSKMGGEVTYPKMGSQTGFDHSHGFRFPSGCETSTSFCTASCAGSNTAGEFSSSVRVLDRKDMRPSLTRSRPDGFHVRGGAVGLCRL